MQVKSDGRGVDHKVIIIGAGFAGIGAAIKLKGAGINDFIVLDKADDVGGTWRDNVYPGVACDVPVLAYEYSFEPNPDWTTLYASGSEIQAYALRCVDKYGVKPHFRPGTEAQSLRFDMECDRWRVATSRGSFTAQFVMLAPGVLAIPKFPEIPGLQTFGGAMCHTARWNVGDALEGRRVGIVGTGASALQVIPEVAQQARQLYVFQRTPIWVLPKVNPRFPPWMRTLFRRVPVTQGLFRRVVQGAFEAFGSIVFLNHARMPRGVKVMERICHWHLQRQVADAELRLRLTPTYGFGCKRPTFSNTYFPAFLKDHVELVTNSLECVTERGVRTDDGREIELDTLILATGFKVFEEDSSPPFCVEGNDGLDLGEYWKVNRFRAYEGVTVPGFPNLFLLPGPYGILTSYFGAIDANTHHALRCIEEAEARGASRVAVRPSADDAFFRDVLRRHRRSLFFGKGCVGVSSYYFDRNGDVPFIRPQSSLPVRRRSRRFSFADYEFNAPPNVPRRELVARGRVR